MHALTFLYAWRDGQQRYDEAQAAVEAQEDLVVQAGFRVGVVHGHERHDSDGDGEEHQSHKRQRRVPHAVILRSRSPADRKRRARGQKKQTAEREGKNTT